MRGEIQVKSGLLKWGKQEQGSEEIDFQALFKHYWNSTAHELLVQGQLESTTSPFIADREGQWTLSLGNIVVLWNYTGLQKLPFVF